MRNRKPVRGETRASVLTRPAQTARRLRSSASWVILVAAGTAGAQETQGDAPGAREGGDAEPTAAATCFNITRAQDINVLNDEYVYVRTFGGNHYLLTMARTCENLHDAYVRGAVRLDPYGRRICPNDGSHFIYDDAGRESVCPILAIDRVAGRAEAKAVAAGESVPVVIDEVAPPE